MRFPSILEPASPAANRVESLWWFLFWISAVVFAVVVVLTLAGLRRRGRLGDPVDRSETSWGDRFVVISGVGVSWIILTIAFVVSLVVMRQLTVEARDAALEIEVIGRMWWWEARYPNGAVTANEIHIPSGERVRLRLTSADVIHSFWVPQLQVKVDQVPGRENELWLEAARPGRYRGQCAEYCGLQHANMIVYVIAQPRAEFNAWLANEARPAPEPVGPAAERGQEVFMSSTCVGCHTIRGTPATGVTGPDLTHLARRETIGAGVRPNTRENLSRLITEPQRIKPGMSMPPTSLTPEELNALLDYLTRLN
ncbi:MAG: cytochrome c oxidase subunit II [Actinomycetota bacterium]|nr:cytochrome c oxidase subunit II [Actinomycetota bacterium]